MPFTPFLFLLHLGFGPLLKWFFQGLIEASGRPASSGKGPVAQEGFQCECPWE